MSLPEHGVGRDEVLARLDAMRAHDVDWRSGRAFTLAYHAGDDVLALQADAFVRFMDDNGLNPDAFPSSRQLQAEVVAMTASLLDAPPDAAGFLTTGGTESLLMAVKAARERGRKERGISEPEMVLPTSAHAAFDKAAHYFGVEAIRVPVGDDFRADPDAMADAVNDNTVLVVGSAPQYPQGVIDPIRSDRCDRSGARHQLPRRRVHRRHHPPDARATRLRDPSVELPRRGRDLDLGRPPQVRLHGEGRIRARAPDARAARATRRSSPTAGSAAPTAPLPSSARSRSVRGRRPGR